MCTLQVKIKVATPYGVVDLMVTGASCTSHVPKIDTQRYEKGDVCEIAVVQNVENMLFEF